MANDSMIGRYLAARAKAVKAGDNSLVRECDLHLDRYGYRPAADAAEEAAAGDRAEAEAKPRRGRPPARRDS